MAKRPCLGQQTGHHHNLQLTQMHHKALLSLASKSRATTISCQAGAGQAVPLEQAEGEGRAFSAEVPPLDEEPPWPASTAATATAAAAPPARRVGSTAPQQR